MEVAIIPFLLFSIVLIVFIAGPKIIEKRKNDNAPIRTIPVIVLEKRIQTKTSSSTDANNNTSYSSYNTFKIIFEHIHKGERHTFSVKESEYDLIVKDDIGYLTYQRKRFKGFVRDYNAKHYNPNHTSKASVADVTLKLEE